MHARIAPTIVRTMSSQLHWLLAIACAGSTAEVELRVVVEGGLHGAASRLADGGVVGARLALDTLAILRVEDSGDKFISLAGEAGLRPPEPQPRRSGRGLCTRHGGRAGALHAASAG